MKVNLEKIDRVCDYIPLISTVSNLAYLFQKHVLLKVVNNPKLSKTNYFVHVQAKDSLRSVVLLIPVLGNIIIAISDWGRKQSEKISNRSLELSRDENFTEAIKTAQTIPFPSIRNSTQREIQKLVAAKFLELAYNGKSSDAIKLANDTFKEISALVHGDNFEDSFLVGLSKTLSEESINLVNNKNTSKAIKLANAIPVKETRDSTLVKLHPIISTETIELTKAGRISEAMDLADTIRVRMFDKINAQFSTL